MKGLKWVVAVAVALVAIGARSNETANAAISEWQIQGIAGEARLRRGSTLRIAQHAEALHAGDQIQTGADGRVLLVHENVQLHLGGDSLLQLAPPSAIPQLIRGAVHLRIPSAVAPAVTPAHPQVQLGRLGVQLDQGEAWLERGERADALCLLRGQLRVHGTDATEVLSEAERCWLYGQRGPRLALPAGEVLPRKLRRTAFHPGSPARRSVSTGLRTPVTVVVASYVSREQAEAAAAKRREQGLDVSVLRFHTAAGLRYRIVTGKFIHWAEAREALRQVQAASDPDAWLSPLPNP